MKEKNITERIVRIHRCFAPPPQKQNMMLYHFKRHRISPVYEAVAAAATAAAAASPPQAKDAKILYEEFFICYHEMFSTLNMN